VTDGTAGKPLSGAIVKLLYCGTTDCITTADKEVTGSDGRYSFPDAKPSKYALSIQWLNSPDCPSLNDPFKMVGQSGDFFIRYDGYLGLGAGGVQRTKQIIAVKEFELHKGQNMKLDLTLACPE
jgi:hypothetical protein